jgi:DNA-binding response OmpR family regulator
VEKLAKQTQSSQKRAILIVEDDEHYANLEEQLVQESFDYPVIIRHDKKSLTTEDIDAAQLIIVDFNLPDTTGQELVKIIRQRSDVPILVVTGNQQLENAINTLKEGANDFLVKSFQTLVLLPNIIERSLREYQNKKLLEEKTKRKELLNAQIETLRQVLTTLAHYINNSTTTIFGYAQLCEQNPEHRSNIEKLIDISIKETTRITFVLQELENLVNNLELKTTSYVDIPDAMFAIENRIKEKMKKFESKKARKTKNPSDAAKET